MLFNSGEFLLFFVVFMVLWPWLRARNNSRWIYLTGASLFFYGWFDWRFVFLLIGTGLVDYLAVLGMVRYPGRRKWFLVASILTNVGTLATFKYLGFCLRNLNHVLSAAGLDAAIPFVDLPLPAGISFYTFQSMSYTIDVYRGELRPARNVWHFFAALSVFPHLVAGPIVRAAYLQPQLETARPASEQQRWAGLKLIIYGYAKKVVIADNLAIVVQGAFAEGVPAQSAALWWVVMVLFAFQIYGDFSGYSDIARGLAKWMGYEFPLNFDHPYISGSFREFWTRWHISLSSWFRDYVYIPLGGSRCQPVTVYRNLWITMVLSGIWHGASWTMLAWGVLHAAYLSIERLTDWPRRVARLPGGRHIATLTVFMLVLVAWVFFRAAWFGQAVQIVGIMFNVTQLNVAAVAERVRPEHLLLVFVLVARHLFFYFGLQRFSWRVPRTVWRLEPVALAGVAWACVYLRGSTQQFMYFQF